MSDMMCYSIIEDAELIMYNNSAIETSHLKTFHYLTLSDCLKGNYDIYGKDIFLIGTVCKLHLTKDTIKVKSGMFYKKAYILKTYSKEETERNLLLL